MSKEQLQNLFSGNEQELRAIINWLNSAAKQLERLLDSLICYSAEMSEYPSLSNSALVEAKHHAWQAFLLLNEFLQVRLMPLAKDVLARLLPAIFPMLELLMGMHESQDIEEFTVAMDRLIAISPRYRRETQNAIRGCILAIVEKEREVILSEPSVATNKSSMTAEGCALSQVSEDDNKHTSNRGGRNPTRESHDQPKLITEHSTDDGEALLFTVNESLSQIRIDGECHEVTSEAARMVKLLLDAKGDWVPMGKNGFTKPSETKGKLPEKVQSRIETSKGKGYRIQRNS